MKKPIEYTDEPLGELSVVPDFLPAPEELIFIEQNAEAKKHQIQYPQGCRVRPTHLFSV